MKEYLDLVQDVLDNGVLKENRTGVNTLYGFSKHYTIDISEKFPLLTTKDMSGFVWNSLIKELVWYLSGEEHIKEFRKTSKIWNAWADEEGLLETAYGRFWRRYPIPEPLSRLDGEAWAGAHKHAQFVGIEKMIYAGNEREVLVLDQIAYILDTLIHNPNSRRMVLTAWHPANASVSKLPPCFVAGTKIATDRGYVPIETVGLGQTVITASGALSTVNEVWKTPYSGSTLTLRMGYMTETLTLTPNHPMLVKGKGWVDAQDLQVGDFLKIPVDKRSVVPTHNVELRGRNQTFELTKDDFYVLGYYLGDGWSSAPGTDRIRVCFSVNHEQRDEILPQLRKMIKISAKPGGGPNVTTYQTRSKKWIELFQSFGHKAHNKIVPDWVHAAPVEYVESFLKGYFDADGSEVPSLKNSSEAYTTVSPHVAYGVQRLMAKVGKVSAVYKQKRPSTCVIEGRVVNQRDTYYIKVLDNPTLGQIEDGDLWLKLEEISENTTFEGHVYNFSVEDEHTYTANNIATHNCHFTAVFSVDGEDRLNCHLTQRSGDIGLGIPFNIACYSALTYILAKASGRKPGKFSHTIVDAHIYCGDGEDDPYSHVKALRTQLEREPLEHPTLEILGDVDPDKPLAFINGLKFEDFVLHDYKAHPRIKMKVAP